LTVRNIGDVSLFFSFYLIFTVPVQARRSAVQKTARDGARSCRFVHIQFMATGRDRPVTLHCAKTKKTRGARGFYHLARHAPCTAVVM
jgi:hypothetical protein